EHFHRYDAIELAVIERQVVYVTGDDLDVLQAPFRRTGFDELFLSTRIGNTGDARVRITFGHPQCERTPAAAEFQDFVTIGDAGTAAGECQHFRFGIVQLGDTGLEVAR